MAVSICSGSLRPIFCVLKCRLVLLVETARSFAFHTIRRNKPRHLATHPVQQSAASTRRDLR